MPATVHLVSGPAAVSRLERLVTAYRHASAEFNSALFLVPTRRLAERIRESLSDCLAPLIYDFQGFADELVRVNEPTSLPNCEADRRLLLDRVLAELSGDQISHFARVSETRGFAEAATGYFLELKDAGAELRQLLKSYPASVGNETHHHQAIRIFERHERRLARSHRLDPADRLRRAASLWELSRRQPFEMVRSVFVAGFTSITLLQQRLMEAVWNSVEHVWIERPDEGNDESAGPRSGIARLTGPIARFVPTETIAAPPSQSVPVHLIEAAGGLGEASQIARHIRGVLARGIRPDHVLVVARRFSPESIELFQEVFDEYEIPHEAESSESLDRAPTVAFLLRAWRVPEEGWEFSQVASILRSTLFRPDWPEVKEDPEIPSKAEALLRMLGETRGRDEFLRAVATWEQLPPEPLEDERPEEPLRLRMHRLASQCRPFLERFFRIWDTPVPEVTAADAVARLKAFADEIGLSRAEPEHRGELSRFWIELDRWMQGVTSTSTRKSLRPNQFARVLATLGAAQCRARSARGSGVALLSAENALGLDCDCLCLVGLGEGSWPELAAPISLLDEAERQRLRQTGLALPNSDERLEREHLLFNALLTAPRRELVLSYAAANDKGQDLLPCSFLREYLGKTPATSASRQSMLLDGYFTREPMSDAELRTQAVYRMNLASPLSPTIIDNLARARTVAKERFESSTYSAFDGELRHPATALELARRVGRDRVFSPTALERYVACPFRFLLQHVLGLQPLEDPSDEVEYTRRGSAFHRALSRFHERLKAKDSELLEGGDRPDSVTEDLVLQIERAVGEYAARAPSRASAELWRLEGKRFERAARRYRAHWSSFRDPWLKQKAILAPDRFEASFGVTAHEGAQPLVLTIGDIEVRIGGTIDRVDLVHLEETVGFWVIDYKTGRAGNYNASQVTRFEKMQLPLYALAVERVLLKDRRARPLGLAYWLVTDTGPKTVLPSGRNAALAWIADEAAWAKFSHQLEEWVARIVTHIRAGDFPLAPRSETCTDTCPFGCICRISQSRNTGKVFALELPVLEGQNPAD